VDLPVSSETARILLKAWRARGTTLTLDALIASLMTQGVRQDVAAQWVRDGLNEGLLYVDRVQPVLFGYWVWIGLTHFGEIQRQVLDAEGWSASAPSW
jgi:hypothetical protein